MTKLTIVLCIYTRVIYYLRDFIKLVVCNQYLLVIMTISDAFIRLVAAIPRARTSGNAGLSSRYSNVPVPELIVSTASQSLNRVQRASLATSPTNTGACYGQCSNGLLAQYTIIQVEISDETIQIVKVVYTCLPIHA